MLDASQVRMARAGLKISVRELSTLSGVADSTILRFEAGKGSILASNLQRIQGALESEGVVFLPAESDGGPGVRLKS